MLVMLCQTRQTLHIQKHIIVEQLYKSIKYLTEIFLYRESMRAIRKILFNFRTLAPEDYLFNQRQSVCAHKTRTAHLSPLPNTNQGDIDLVDEVQLMGVTRIPEAAPTQQRFTDEVQLLAAGGTDLMFLQVDPSDYMARQRFMSHKCAMGGVQDYRLDGIETIDPHRPITWEEAVVNLFTMDMLVNNSLPANTTYKHGMYAYSYPFLQDNPEKRGQITPVLIDSISKYILGGKRTDFPLVEKFLYTGLMGRHKVLLGGMPETLYKMILGKGLSIHEMRDIFRTILLKNKELTTPFTTKQAAQNFMPHIFNLPKDLYMTALLKEAFQAAIQIACVVGMEHWRPIQQYWIGAPHGINMAEATRIPDGFPGQTTQDLIEKQAILDVLLETRTWSKPYLSNPFPYLFVDITKIDRKELDHYKQIFLMHYLKYSEFKSRETRLLPEGQATPLLMNSQQRQEVLKTADQLKEGPTLSHLKKKMDMKIDKGIFSFLQ